MCHWPFAAQRDTVRSTAWLAPTGNILRQRTDLPFVVAALALATLPPSVFSRLNAAPVDEADSWETEGARTPPERQTEKETERERESGEDITYSADFSFLFW